MSASAPSSPVATEGEKASPWLSLPPVAAATGEAAAGSVAVQGRWRRQRTRARSSLFAAGEPMLWLTGGGLVICVVMVFGLMALIFTKGMATFWPLPVVQIETFDARPYLGEVTREERFQPAEHVIEGLPPAILAPAQAQLAANAGWASRRLLRTGNYRLTQNHFNWISDFEVKTETLPEWALVIERLEWGRYYGFPEAFLRIHSLGQASAGPTLSPTELRAQAEQLAAQLPAATPHELRWLDQRAGQGEVLLPLAELDNAQALLGLAEVVPGKAAAWAEFQRHHAAVRERWKERRKLEKVDTGEVNYRQEQARLAVRQAELELDAAANAGQNHPAQVEALAKLAAAEQEFTAIRSWADQEFARIRREIDQINRENASFQLLLRTAGEGTLPPQTTLIRMDEIVRAYPANQLGFAGKVEVYLARWQELLRDEPREANSEGGVYPAIFGTVAMTLIMSLVVVPFGVLAALYLREYAKAGALVSAVRIAVNNLAGVPSIVFGVFGLGFFCYTVGASLDELLFAAHLPNPTYGKGGLLWAALTLALLTLPVVIVATEEAVAAVPNSLREGSYACGASKWQTIQRIVLPRALPGIITGMILAIARGAGEVAPLMLVGAVKLAPELPLDGAFPFVHPERSFMHLGFHIFDVGFQSQNSEAAKPMVFTTTLLLILIIAALNFLAIWLRSHLRRRYAAGKF